MSTYKLVLEYDGTHYVGWQAQANGISIQDKLEKAISLLLQEPIVTIAGGRTDAGVHARGQAVSFTSFKGVEPLAFASSLNGVLPRDIVVLSCHKTKEGFHARYDATSRRYRYFLQKRHTALMRDFCWYVGGYSINMDLLRSCASKIMGEHDFSSFCKVHSSAGHHRCTVYSASWSESDSTIEFEIRANRFLYGMVRALVGTMVEVARGHRKPEEFVEILEAKDRRAGGMSAPARGLFLEEITY